MSATQGTQGQGSVEVVDYAQLVVQIGPKQKRLEYQLNERDFNGAMESALELKVLMAALYWHLVERPHLAIHYDACIHQTQTACTERSAS